VQVACEDRPCMIQLELCQQHMLLAPACGVLLLPSDKAEVAAELHARVALTAAKRKVMSTVTMMEYACFTLYRSKESPHCID
jgi:hypothetical protein